MQKLTTFLFILLIGGWIPQCAKQDYPSTHSKEALSLYKTGENYRMNLYHRRALNQYLEALRLDTNFAMAALRSGQMYLSFGSNDSGQYYFELARKFADQLPEVERLIIGYHWSEYTHNTYRRARIVDSLVTFYPNIFDARIIKAVATWEKLEYEKARKQYQNLLRENPNYIIAYNNIGYLYALDGLFQDALTYLEKYKRSAAGQLNPYDSLAEIYLAIGKYYEAIHLLENLIENRKAELIENEYLGVIVYSRLTTAYCRIGKYRKALSLLDEAETIFRSERSLTQINMVRFLIYNDLEKLTPMKAALDKIQAIHGENSYPYHRAMVALEQNDFDEVLKILETQKSKRQTNETISRMTLVRNAAIEAELNFKTGLFEEAAAKFKLAADTYNDTLNAVGLRLKQHIAEGKSGNYTAAINGLRNRIKVNPNCPLALVALAEFYVKIRKPAEARTYISHFQNLWKNADPGTPLMLRAEAVINVVNPPV